MKITDLTTHGVAVSPQRSWLFIAVRTDVGLVGWGEASQTRNDAAVANDVAAIARQYIGRSPLDLVEPSQIQLRWPYIGKSLHAAVSGIEQALWDLSGKKLGVPVHQLLGGALRKRLRAYANVGYALRDESPAEYVRVSREVVAQGFTAIKLYAFGEKPDTSTGPGALRDWIEAGIERTAAVRSAIGPRIDLMVDLMHQIDDFRIALEIAGRLEPQRLFWLEDPFVHEIPEVLERYRTAIRTRLAVGAPCLDFRHYRALLQAQATDLLMPDVKWIGGVSALKKAAVVADVHGLMFAPHNASGPIATAASVHASATASNFSLLEYAWGVPEWRSRLCQGADEIEDGHFIVPDRAGLGIDLDESVLHSHAATGSNAAASPMERSSVAQQGRRTA
ncbi:MAG: mandelate racemase/muconate lactonizing enzyme family protein [Lautropia sp.]